MDILAVEVIEEPPELLEEKIAEKPSAESDVKPKSKWYQNMKLYASALSVIGIAVGSWLGYQGYVESRYEALEEKYGAWNVMVDNRTYGTDFICQTTGCYLTLRPNGTDLTAYIFKLDHRLGLVSVQASHNGLYAEWTKHIHQFSIFGFSCHSLFLVSISCASGKGIFRLACSLAFLSALFCAFLDSLFET